MAVKLQIVMMKDGRFIVQERGSFAGIPLWTTVYPDLNSRVEAEDFVRRRIQQEKHKQAKSVIAEYEI